MEKHRGMLRLLFIRLSLCISYTEEENEICFMINTLLWMHCVYPCTLQIFHKWNIVEPQICTFVFSEM